MNTAELKSDLHRLIVETNDIDVLFDIRQYFLQLKAKDVDWWDLISTEQKESIQKGIEQLEKGEGIAHQKVRQKVNKLLEKMDSAIEVIWSSQAEISYLGILSYIIDEWSVKDAGNFDNKTERLIEKLRTNLSLCPKSKIVDLRKCHITHQTSMVYRVVRNCIEIVDFISNYTVHAY